MTRPNCYDMVSEALKALRKPDLPQANRFDLEACILAVATYAEFQAQGYELELRKVTSPQLRLVKHLHVMDHIINPENK